MNQIALRVFLISRDIACGQLHMIESETSYLIQTQGRKNDLILFLEPDSNSSNHYLYLFFSQIPQFSLRSLVESPKVYVHYCGDAKNIKPLASNI